MLLYTDGQANFSGICRIHIVDRIDGGLIYSLLSGIDCQKAIDFPVAASCLKHTIEQDYNLLKVSEVLALPEGNGSGRVQR